MYEKNKDLESNFLLSENGKKELESANNQLDNMNKQLESDLDALSKTNQEIMLRIDQLSHAVLQLETENPALQAEKENLEKSVEELKAKIAIGCAKSNACQFRTPGAGFRCGADEVYNPSGDFWCECDPNCEVEVK